MTYRSKPCLVEAFCFAGTEASAEEAEEWVRAHDISDAEVSWQTNSFGSTALDVTTAYGIRTLEAGDYLCITQNGRLDAQSRETFEQYYERAD